VQVTWAQFFANLQTAYNMTGGGTIIVDGNDAAVVAEFGNTSDVSALPADVPLAQYDPLSDVAQAQAGLAISDPLGEADYQTISNQLDAQVGNAVGLLLVRSASGWRALAPGTSGTKLTSQGPGALPTWT